ncbi:GntP family permease [Virgibacillus halotolerans]|uniref:GntP family permease n=1 Tax=Virgibacillus halotolerans TaxID=1071053 RepID=UPI001960F503|nr:GntP family permease [Virgibacillus halotolerans]
MLGILLGLIVLLILSYKGWSIIWVAPIAAGVVALTGGLDLLDTYRDTYMGGFVDFAEQWFPVFMLGAIFAKLMEITGMARTVAVALINLFGAKRAILGILLSTVILTYGGVSSFVVVFAVYPLALELFREGNLPRRLIPPTIALGAFTFTAGALPGNPQINNLIPMDYFNTTAMAAPLMGSITGLFIGGTGYFYLCWREKSLTQKGETFTEPKDKKILSDEDGKPPSFIVSIIPMLVVLIMLNLLGQDIIIALVLGITSIVLLSVFHWKKFISAMNEGASGSVLAIINTSAAVGFGAVVQAVPSFSQIVDFFTGMKGNPLISEAISINILTGVTGSGSGGLEIALNALGENFYQIALNTGISPEAFHRVASLSSTGMDAMPHNGAVITVLIVTGFTHKEAYKDIFVVAVVIPILGIAVAILLASMGII